MTILHHPRPVLSPPADQPDLTYYDSHPSLSRDELKQFMRTNQITSGESPLSTLIKRRPFAGELVSFPSPDDETIIFYIKRCGVRENVTRQNLSSTVRYVERSESGEYATERDFPVGDMNLKTVALALGDWNLADDNGNKLPINEDTIQTYVTPTEFPALYDKVIEVNPMWGRGEAQVKKS